MTSILCIDIFTLLRAHGERRFPGRPAAGVAKCRQLRPRILQASRHCKPQPPRGTHESEAEHSTHIRPVTSTGSPSPPARPARAVLFDAIPGDLSVDEAGHIEGAGVGGTIALLVVPLLTLIGNGTYFYIQYVAPARW